MRGRVPVIRQQTATECGLACLAMVLAHHGRRTTLRALRDTVDIGRDGASLRTLVALARSAGMDTHAYRAPAAKLTELPLPLVLHWEDAHYVVLERIMGDKVHVVDPGLGRRTMSWVTFEKSYAGIALSARPGPEFRRQRGERFAIGAFIAGYIPHRIAPLLLLFVASLVLVLLAIIPAFLTRFFVDQFIPSGDVGLVGFLALMIALFGLCHILCFLARAELLLWLQTVMDLRMMRRFMSHLLALPYKYFQTRRGGDLLVRAGSTSFVRDVLSGQMLAIAIDSLLVVVYFTLIARTSVPLALTLVAVAVLQVLLILVTLPAAKRFAQDELVSMSEAQSALLETISGIETVKACGAESESYARWGEQFDRQLHASVRRRRLDVQIESLLGGLRIALPPAVTLVGAVIVLNGSLTAGDMLALSALAGAALAPVSTLGHSLQSLQTVGVHLDRVRDVLEEPIEEVQEDAPKYSLSGQISLRNVSFRYGTGSPWALEGIDLEIPAHSRIAIVGASGSGKSTLARVVTGLLQAEGGSISLDGHALKDLNLRHFRQQCGVVTQSPSMMSGSLRHNVTISAPGATDSEVWEALEAAALADEVRCMPLGLATPLGDGGLGLSGGQLQRLAIARAVIRRPRILVLDEATSHLDSGSENRVFEHLHHLDCTQILVAHRLSTVRDADLIVCLAHGRVVGQGTHSELFASCAEYQHLINRQLPAMGAPALIDTPFLSSDLPDA